MTLLWWILAVAGLLLALLIVQGIYLGAVLRWEDEQSVGLAYYGLPPEGRERFKRRLRRHAVLLAPILWLNRRLARLDFRKVAFQYKGVAGPLGSCSPDSFAAGEGYQARPEDVFVVTQMKCGTTWMQHLVYQVLTRGAGDLVGTGATLYAASPWLEGRKSVPMNQAPLVGTEHPSRIIKTHFPAQLCPVGGGARFIYVVRHPVSCFASCRDFVITNAGGMAPDLGAFEEWFRSPELMWWGIWPDHVRGWWERAARDGNVLWVHFEDMKRDLPAVTRQVAEFLGVRPLDDRELAQVVEKCGFAYMQRHQGSFEMNPPHVLQTNAELFVRGTADRHSDVPEDARRRILAWSAAAAAGLPPARAYPDLAAAVAESRDPA